MNKFKLSDKRNTKTALIFTYMHLPERFMFLANPPKDITKDKYNDILYLKRVSELINELKKKDFNTRSDGVLPYGKDIILKHIKDRIKYLEEKQ